MNLNPNPRESGTRRLASTPTGANRERLPSSSLDDIAQGAVFEIVIGAVVVLIHFAALFVFV